MINWIILQVSAPATIRLAKSLAEAGFDAWTPTETVKPEPPQQREGERPRKARKLPETVTRPLYKTFVFANAEHLTDLIALSRSPALTYQVWDPEKRRMVMKGHPYFTLFSLAGRYPTVPDSALDPVRRIASRRKPRSKSKTFAPGDRVRLTEHAWGGLYGVVQRKIGKLYEVEFEGYRQSVKLPPEMLHPVIDDAASIHHNATQPERGIPHRSAA